MTISTQINRKIEIPTLSPRALTIFLDLGWSLGPERIMNMSAEAKLPKIAKNASATMNFIQAIISAPRQRSLLVVTMATVLGVALTVCLA
jgi:hypothetical protein